MRRKRYTQWDKVKVIYRKKDGNIIAFLPELRANVGNIVCYEHIGQHGEASLEYYHTTEKATPTEYAELHKELQKVYGHYELNVKMRLCYDDLTAQAWKNEEG